MGFLYSDTWIDFATVDFVLSLVKSPLFETNEIIYKEMSTS